MWHDFFQNPLVSSCYRVWLTYTVLCPELSNPRRGLGCPSPRLSFLCNPDTNCPLLDLWPPDYCTRFPLSPISSPHSPWTWPSSVCPCSLWTFPEIPVSDYVILHIYGFFAKPRRNHSLFLLFFIQMDYSFIRFFFLFLPTSSLFILKTSSFPKSLGI